MITNREQTADILGVSKTTVDSWVRKGCPVIENGKKGVPSKYDTVAVINWVYQDNDDGLDLQQEKAKLAKMQTEKAAIQIAEMKGELVDAEEVKESWITMITACRAKLLALPTKIAGDVFGVNTQAEIQAIIKREIYQALTELSKGD